MEAEAAASPPPPFHPPTKNNAGRKKEKKKKHAKDRKGKKENFALFTRYYQILPDTTRFYPILLDIIGDYLYTCTPPSFSHRYWQPLRDPIRVT